VVEAEHDGISTLTLTFIKGGKYRYVGVPLTVYEDLTRAESPGRFVHANIVDRYATFKL
jgi:hypothetical protein